MTIQSRLKSLGLAVALCAGTVMTSAPAHAYKVDDTLELKVKVFARWLEVQNDPAASGMQLHRAYVEARKHLDTGDMIRVTLDQKSDDSKMFVKYAYWQHVLPVGAKVKLGLHHTPLVDYDNNTMWGYRFVAKAFTDQWKAQTSSDSGVSLTGTLADDKLTYYLSVLNGEGYQNPVDGNGYAVAGRVEFQSAGFHLGVFAHEEGNRGGDSSYDPNRQVAYAFFENDAFRLGGQFLQADDGDPAHTFLKGTGYNVQGRINLPMGHKASVFARYDSIDKTDTGVDETMTLAGLSFTAASGVTLAPTYRVDDDGTDKTTTAGLYAQFKF